MEKLKDVVIWVLAFLFFFFLLAEEASAASLFDVTDENSPFYPELEEEESSLPDYATNADGEILINNDTTLNEVLNPDFDSFDTEITDMEESVSDGDALSGQVSYADMQSFLANQLTLADVEALLEDSLADTRAANISVADAYLSSAIVDVFSRVVDGCPAHYKYVAYRVNSSDGNEGFLLIGPDAKVNGNYLDFESGTMFCHYYRSQYTVGYQTYYNYKYDVTQTYDVYRVPYNSGSLIYTNMVSGYPVLSEDNQTHIGSLVIPVFIVFCIFIIFRRMK